MKKEIINKTDRSDKRYGDSYGVKKMSAVAFVFICVIAAVLVVQVYGIKHVVTKKLLGETAGLRAGFFEELLSAGEKRLEALKNKNITQVSNLLPEGKMKDVENTGIFSSVYVTGTDSLFSDGDEMPQTGVVLDGDIPKVYNMLEAKSMLVGEIDILGLLNIANFSGNYEGYAEHILFDSKSGAVIINTGKDYGFDGTSIGFLGEYDFEQGYSAKKMFSDISNKRGGYTVINNTAGESFSFAYRPVGSYGWYLMQLLPESKLKEAAFQSSAPFAAGIVILVAGALAFMLWIFTVTKKMSLDKALDSYNGRIMRRLLSQTAESSGASLFIYNRSNDEICVFRDREGFHLNGVVYSDAFGYLEKHYGHSEQDVRRLKNAIALAGPQSSIKLSLESESADGSKKLSAEYTLCSVKNEDASKGDCVACTVIERSSDGNAEFSNVTLDEENGVYNTTGIEVHLERNSWRFLWNNEECLKKLGFGTEMRKNYDNDVDKSISPFVMTSDRQLFSRTISRLNLLESYRNGNTDLCVKYRLNVGNGVYEYRILDIHMYRDAKTDEIKANFYARHMGKS